MSESNWSHGSWARAYDSRQPQTFVNAFFYLRQSRRYMFFPVFVCNNNSNKQISIAPYASYTVCLSVCLSVCLLARLLKNACMDLDQILRVDRCRDMDELINFWARSGSKSGCRTGLLSPISYMLRNFAALHRLPASCVATRNFTSGKSHVYVHIGGAPLEREEVLKWYLLPRDAMYKRGLCRHAVSVCMSVCHSRSCIV